MTHAALFEAVDNKQKHKTVKTAVPAQISPKLHSRSRGPSSGVISQICCERFRKGHGEPHCRSLIITV